MKHLPLVVLLFLTPLWGDEAADRAEIQNVLTALDQRIRSPESVSADAPGDFDASDLEQLRAAVRRMEERADTPWSEATRPKLTVKTVRFVTGDLALADVAYRQYGSTLPFDVSPLLILLKHNGARWRVIAIRSLVDCTGTQPH